MQLARYMTNAGPRIGLIVDGHLLEVWRKRPALPTTMTRLLAEFDAHRQALQRALGHADGALPLESVRLLAPVEEPRRFLALGLNYKDHATEMGIALPKQPRLFAKLAGALAAPQADVVAPAFSSTLDYEGELALVIGRRCRAVARQRAHEVIAGYMVLNDYSVREYVNPDLVILGKSCPGFAPCGPWLTTADEVQDPQALPIKTWVNGELRQNSTTREMIFGCAELIEWITRAVELEPGDLITTGSPPGSGAGMRPARFLRPGDAVRVEIEGLGALTNRIIAEDPHTSKA